MANRTVVITNDWTGVLVARVETRVQKELEEIAKKAVALAKSFVRVRTGRLRDSIHAEVLKTRVKIVADATREQDLISYAWWVETGTGRGPAQPFLRPALHAMGHEITEQFSKWILV